METPNPNELFVEYTHNSKKSTHNCSNNRPCYRLAICSYCRRKKKKYLQDQLIAFQKAWELQNFLTITICKFEGDEAAAFTVASEFRKKATPVISSTSKYICFLVVGERVCEDTGLISYTPHLHYIVGGTLDLERLKKLAHKKMPFHKMDFHNKVFDDDPRELRNISGYLIDQNYFKSIPIKPKKKRLVTASRGIKVGRPNWSVVIEAKNNSALWEAK